MSKNIQLFTQKITNGVVFQDKYSGDRTLLLSSCSPLIVLMVSSLWFIQPNPLKAMENPLSGMETEDNRAMGRGSANSRGFYKDAKHPLTQEFWQNHDLSDRLTAIKQKIEIIKNKISTSSSNLISVSDDDIQIYKVILKSAELDSPHVQDLPYIHYDDLLMKADSSKKTTNGWSGADTKDLSNDRVKIFAKKFGDIKAGLEELLQSLIALDINPSPQEIKMARIYDATFCSKNSADSEDCLSIIMEGAQGHDIEDCLNKDWSTDAINACAQYLAMFHIKNHENIAKNINIKEKYLDHVAHAYHTLIRDLLKEEECTLLNLAVGPILTDIEEVNAENIIRSLITLRQEEFRCIAQKSCKKLEKNAGKIYRSLLPSQSQHTRSSVKVKSSSQSFAINSNDKDKIDSYQKRKDEHDQRRLARHIDLAESEAEQGNDDLSLYHKDEIVNISGEREDRLLALSIANASNNDSIRLNNQAPEDFLSSSTEKQTPYFLTITHGDAHGNNFFYDEEDALNLPKDSFQRITMIDFATIIRTYSGIGDPAEDVGRFLGSLWDWGVRQAFTGSEVYQKIQTLQKEFIDSYLKLIKDSKIIKEDHYKKFEKTFKENCNFYKLRYYKVIFNAIKDKDPQKDRDIKVKILNSWLEENSKLRVSLQATAQENYIREESEGRNCKAVEDGGICYHLPERSKVFIESFDKKNESYLTLLWKELHNTNTETLSSNAAIAGMGGVGKTSLALEYAHEARKKNAYNSIYWLSSGTESSLIQGYKNLLLEMRIPIIGKDKDGIINLVKDELPKKGKCLLIYDNVPGPNFLTGKVPEKVHILATSRNNKGWEKPPIHLDVFRPKDSRKYLFKVTSLEKTPENKKIAKELAEALADELGHLPLALSHAAHYIKLVGGKNVSVNHFEKYLEEFRKDDYITHLKEKKDSFKNPKSEITYENLIARTLRIQKKYFKEGIAESAEKFLASCSYLNPDSIEENIFLEHLPNNGEKKTMKEILKTMSLLSLTTRTKEKSSFSIHRLVQAVIRNEMENKENFHHACDTINGLLSIFEFTTMNRNVQNPPTYGIDLDLMPTETILSPVFLGERPSVDSLNNLKKAQVGIFAGDQGGKLYCKVSGKDPIEITIDEDAIETTIKGLPKDIFDKIMRTVTGKVNDTGAFEFGMLIEEKHAPITVIHYKDVYKNISERSLLQFLSLSGYIPNIAHCLNQTSTREHAPTYEEESYNRLDQELNLCEQLGLSISSRWMHLVKIGDHIQRFSRSKWIQELKYEYEFADQRLNFEKRITQLFLQLDEKQANLGESINQLLKKAPLSSISNEETMIKLKDPLSKLAKMVLESGGSSTLGLLSSENFLLECNQDSIIDVCRGQRAAEVAKLLITDRMDRKTQTGIIEALENINAGQRQEVAEAARLLLTDRMDGEIQAGIIDALAYVDVGQRQGVAEAAKLLLTDGMNRKGQAQEIIVTLKKVDVGQRQGVAEAAKLLLTDGINKYQSLYIRVLSSVNAGQRLRVAERAMSVLTDRMDGDDREKIIKNLANEIGSERASITGWY